MRVGLWSTSSIELCTKNCHHTESWNPFHSRVHCFNILIFCHVEKSANYIETTTATTSRFMNLWSSIVTMRREYERERETKQKNNINRPKNFNKNILCDALLCAINVITSFHSRLSHGNKLTIQIKRATQHKSYSNESWRHEPKQCINHVCICEIVILLLFLFLYFHRFFSISFERTIDCCVHVCVNVSSLMFVLVQPNEREERGKNVFPGEENEVAKQLKKNKIINLM